MDAILGSRVSLFRTEKKDLPELLSLWNDGRVMRWVGFPEGVGETLEGMQRWLERTEKSRWSRHFVVREEGTFLGEVFFVMDAQGRAGLDVKFVPEAQGRDLAREALELLIAHCFRAFEVVKEVWTEPSSENLAARNLYARCGLSAAPRPSDFEEGESYWRLTREEWQACRVALLGGPTPVP